MARTIEAATTSARGSSEDRRRWWVLVAMVFGLFMPVLDNLVVNVALPTIQHKLGAQRLRACSGSSTRTRSPSPRSCSPAAPSATCTDASASSWAGSGSSPSGRSSCGLSALHRPAGRLPGPAGPRRGHAASRVAVDHHGHLQRQGARCGHRDLGGHVGPRHRHRPGGRRLPRRARLVAEHLLRQRPGRDPRPHPDVDVVRGVPDPEGPAGSTRRA